MNILCKNKSCLGVGLCGLFFMFVFFQMNILNSLRQPLHELGLSNLQISYISAVLYISNFLFLFISGQLLDKFSHKKIMTSMFFLASVATIFFSLSNTFFQFMLSRFLIGVAGAFCFLGPLKYASTNLSKDKLGFVIGVYGFMGFLGGYLSQKTFYALMALLGWRYTSFIIGVAGLLMTLLFLFFVKDNHYRSSTDENLLKTFHSFFKMIYFSARKKTNLASAAYVAIMNSSIGIFGALWGNYYLQNYFKLDANIAVTISSLLFIGHIVSAPLLGLTRDYLINPRLLMFSLSSIALIATLQFLMLPPNANIFFIGFLFFILGFSSAIQPVVYAYIAEENTAELTATSTSLLSLAIMLSLSIIQLFIGYLNKYAPTLTTLHCVLYMLAGMYLLSMFLSGIGNPTPLFKLCRK